MGGGDGMFKKTQTRIVRTLMLIAALLVCLIAVPSISMFSSALFNVHKTMAKNKLDRSLSACRIYIDSVMTSTDNLSGNQTVAETVSGQRTGSITAILDGTCSYSLAIDAITVYSADGKIYTSSGVVSPPSLEALKNNAEIAEFLADSELTDYVSFRTSEIIKAYNNTPYDASSGIISCCRKIYGTDGTVTGYIFSDIFPKTIFEYFSYSNDNALKDCKAIILFNGGYFVSSDSENVTRALIDADPSIRSGYIIISAVRNFYGGKIRLAVPTRPFFTDVARMTALILSIGGCLLAGTYLIARKTARDLTMRLNRLLIKITSTSNGLA